MTGLRLGSFEMDLARSAGILQGESVMQLTAPLVKVFGNAPQQKIWKELK